jgi:oxygen-independent coproporphyrinogen-3 oxidase
MTTVDYYTLNNVVAQTKMHRGFEEHNLQPLSANTKLSFRMFLNEYLRARGYVPDNGYSFTKNTSPAGSPRKLIQRDRVFLYQEITYGFANDYVDGYGAGAFGTMNSHAVHNISNREQYAARLLSSTPQPWFEAHRGLNAANKGVVYFPYRGFLDKSRVDWANLAPDTKETLDHAVQDGLAADCGDHYELTDAGWLFSVNLMYQLMPYRDRVVLSDLVRRSEKRADRRPDNLVLLTPTAPKKVTPA